MECTDSVLDIVPRDISNNDKDVQLLMEKTTKTKTDKLNDAQNLDDYSNIFVEELDCIEEVEYIIESDGNGIFINYSVNKLSFI